MTKSEKKADKPKKLYPEKDFNINQLNYCCGVGEVGGFNDERGVYDWYKDKYSAVKKKYATREEQAEACYRKILERSKNEYDAGYFTQLICTLVSSYGPGNDYEVGSHQFQELADILIREGWTISSVFINPRHGNEITMFTKYFPERHMSTKEFEEMADGADNW